MEDRPRYGETVASFTDAERIAALLMEAQEDAATKMKIANDYQRQLKENTDEAAVLEAEQLDMAYRTGAIDGKNAEARERQTVLYLAQNSQIKAARLHIAKLQRMVDDARIESEIANKRLGALHSVANLTAAQLMFMAGSARANF